MENHDVVILGAGASGIMCALRTAERGRRTVLLDHNEILGRKILVSGGGRCNFTNLLVEPEHYVSRNPNFCRSALSRFAPRHFLAILDEHGVEYAERECGQMFCKGRASAIVEMFERECRRRGVRIATGCRIFGVEKPADRFEARTSAGDFSSESLVVAMGGLSWPQIGATDFGHRIARQFGHGVVETAPALAGFLLPERDWYRRERLAGISIRAGVECEGRNFEGELLFTHRGVSGPVALQASLHWRRNAPIRVDLAPGRNAREWLAARRAENPKSRFETLLSEILPRRLAGILCEHMRMDCNVSELSNARIAEVESALHSWRTIPEGTVGYEKAEVTRGGVDTAEISSKTMESKKVRGLFFAGEVLDVTGMLGGYNLHWAWASGRAAGDCA